MDYSDLQEMTIEDVVQHVPISSHAYLHKAVAAVTGRCTIEVGERLGEVGGILFETKKMLHTVNGTLADASEQAAKQTAALVLWTKVLAFATAAYTLIAGGLLYVALTRGGAP